MGEHRVERKKNPVWNGTKCRRKEPKRVSPNRHTKKPIRSHRIYFDGNCKKRHSQHR